jgi:hypothetical protein
VYVGFSAYFITVTMQRALVTGPLVVLSARDAPEERAASAQRALALVMGGAAVSAAILLVLGLFLPSVFGNGLLLFVPWLMGALLQDFWRALLFRYGRGVAAALNDACGLR